ncbi:MAG: hypothetical protein QGG58_09290, partial [Chloroflexota bacterium]|nr:hypothetical protein [Chloroflexota bacterium]
MGDQIAAYLQVALACAVAAIAAGAARMLFPEFCSRESKSGSYRPGAAATTSSRLPLVGGPAVLLAVLVVAALAGEGSRMLTVVAAGALFFAIGFVDDLRKARTGRGFGDGASMLLAVVAAVQELLEQRAAEPHLMVLVVMAVQELHHQLLVLLLLVAAAAVVVLMHSPQAAAVLVVLVVV